MDELVEIVIDAVLIEMDDTMRGYWTEFGGSDFPAFEAEIREDLRERIKDTLTAAAGRGIICVRPNP